MHCGSFALTSLLRVRTSRVESTGEALTAVAPSLWDLLSPSRHRHQCFSHLRRLARPTGPLTRSVSPTAFTWSARAVLVSIGLGKTPLTTRDPENRVQRTLQSSFADRHLAFVCHEQRRLRAPVHPTRAATTHQSRLGRHQARPHLPGAFRLPHKRSQRCV